MEGVYSSVAPFLTRVGARAVKINHSFSSTGHEKCYYASSQMIMKYDIVYKVNHLNHYYYYADIELIYRSASLANLNCIKTIIINVKLNFKRIFSGMGDRRL